MTGGHAASVITYALGPTPGGVVQTIRCKQKIRSVAIAPSQSAKGGVALTIALVNNSLEVTNPPAVTDTNV